MLDPIAIEQAEAQINQFIERRSRESSAEREREEMYAESVRRYHARRQERNRELWRAYYLDQAERLERTAGELAASHRARAGRLLEEPTGSGSRRGGRVDG